MQMRRRLHEFLQALPKVENHVREQARKDGEKEAYENLNKSTSRLIEHIDTKLKESEKRLRSIEDCIALPMTTAYIVFVIMVALFVFMLCTLIWNLHFLHDSQIWKYFGGTIGLAAIEIFMVIYIPKWIDRLQKR